MNDKITQKWKNETILQAKLLKDRELERKVVTKNQHEKIMEQQGTKQYNKFK